MPERWPLHHHLPICQITISIEIFFPLLSSDIFIIITLLNLLYICLLHSRVASSFHFYLHSVPFVTKHRLHWARSLIASIGRLVFVNHNHKMLVLLGDTCRNTKVYFPLVWLWSLHVNTDKKRSTSLIINSFIWYKRSSHVSNQALLR